MTRALLIFASVTFLLGPALSKTPEPAAVWGAVIGAALFTAVIEWTLDRFVDR